MTEPSRAIKALAVPIEEIPPEDLPHAVYALGGLLGDGLAPMAVARLIEQAERMATLRPERPDDPSARFFRQAAAILRGVQARQEATRR